jgi:DNA gyrase subunit A
MQRSYLDYAMSVIVSRALPDVRDGLKPVHRRILYAMHEGGYHWNRKYVKSSRIVGDVMGKYHPHGDQRSMTPWCAWRRTGRCGAAGRRTGQFRLDRRRSAGRDALHGIASGEGRARTARGHRQGNGRFPGQLRRSEHEPTVLPARFPNLLVNGAGGIAVGMATNIPPHNLSK